MRKRDLEQEETHHYILTHRVTLPVQWRVFMTSSSDYNPSVLRILYMSELWTTQNKWCDHITRVDNDNQSQGCYLDHRFASIWVPHSLQASGKSPSHSNSIRKETLLCLHLCAMIAMLSSLIASLICHHWCEVKVYEMCLQKSITFRLHLAAHASEFCEWIISENCGGWRCHESKRHRLPSDLSGKVDSNPWRPYSDPWYSTCKVSGFQVFHKIPSKMKLLYVTCCILRILKMDQLISLVFSYE